MVEIHAGDAGTSQVVDSDGIRAAESGDVDLLDAVVFHGDVAHVAGQPQRRLPLADGSKFSLTLAALNCKVSWPTWPSTVSLSPLISTKKCRPPGTADKACHSLRPAGDRVVAVAAHEHVVAIAAGERVDMPRAIDGNCDQGQQAIAGREGIVAAIGVENQILRRCRCRY